MINKGANKQSQIKHKPSVGSSSSFSAALRFFPFAAALVGFSVAFASASSLAPVMFVFF
jgi:hypothetical protein